MDAAVVTVGDELLAGDIENTNATWLCSELTARGVSVGRVTVIPDDEAAIVETVRELSDAFDAVIVTGGLGNTPDDRTMEAVAAAFDRDLVVDELALEAVERRVEQIRDRYPDFSVDLEAEAAIPVGARPLVNKAGLSPGCVVENVTVLPGIPREMKPMFQSVADEFSGEGLERTLYTRIPEAHLIEPIETGSARFSVEIGCYPNRADGYNRLKLTGTDPEELDDAAAWLREAVDATDEPPS